MQGEQKKNIYIQTLYIIFDTCRYPQNCLRFDGGIKKLKPNSQKLITIQISSKSNYLQCDNMKDLNFGLIYVQLHYLNIMVRVQKD